MVFSFAVRFVGLIGGCLTPAWRVGGVRCLMFVFYGVVLLSLVVGVFVMV